jgi:WD40 repeat protein
VVKTWDASTGQELLSLSLNGNVPSVAFSPDSAQLAAASEDGTFEA